MVKATKLNSTHLHIRIPHSDVWAPLYLVISNNPTAPVLQKLPQRSIRKEPPLPSINRYPKTRMYKGRSLPIKWDIAYQIETSDAGGSE